MPKRAAASKPKPEIVKMGSQRMAVVYTRGDPNKAGREAISALYGSVYTLKFHLKKQGKDFKVAPLRARWPDAHLVPKKQWLGIWGLPVPVGTSALPEKVPGVEVKVETWKYGAVAQILHIGPFSTEPTTVQRLHKFIAESGYEIAGVHEEEYLTRPTAKVQKTIIRYPIKRKPRSRGG